MAAITGKGIEIGLIDHALESLRKVYPVGVQYFHGKKMKDTLSEIERVLESPSFCREVKGILLDMKKYAEEHPEERWGLSYSTVSDLLKRMVEIHLDEMEIAKSILNKITDNLLISGANYLGVESSQQCMKMYYWDMEVEVKFFFFYSYKVITFQHPGVRNLEISIDHPVEESRCRFIEWLETNKETLVTIKEEKGCLS